MPDSTQPRPPIERVAVLIPTYNERENLPLVVERVRASVPTADVVVLDDNSPDGTGDIADELAAADDHVKVMHREGKEGLGAAYLAGFAWALERGYDAVVEMDADGSHRPEHLPTMLEVAADADLVIGSRYVRGGKIVNWPIDRKAISMAGNLYIKVILGMPVNDATAGYRVYRAETLRIIGLDQVESAGYVFQTDLTVRTVRAGLTVVEVPITFIEREIGVSKMDGDVVRESMARITRWGLTHRRRQVRGLLDREPTWHRL
ncbi:dolichol-phosphate mannosyltransferase [Janibacter sp. Soil728]|uniref:polyprenol monophosphomannose synthase n=1 Tax=Janibacter sp. Soil728 TaxID=1736393 RepID=UPI000701034D|nr:polyprenol monophosphomannose synthase [Janibacter sp. Soil728]KRE36969.1 dolichol-phosphate mannosyltransferase [Janibacter sp. Soil728]